MELIGGLLGLIFATIAVIGWFYGSAFWCVLLTLPVLFPAGLAVLLASDPGSNPRPLMTISIVLLGIIWTPFTLRRLTWPTRRMTLKDASMAAMAKEWAETTYPRRY